MEAVDELEAEGRQEGDAEQDVRPDGVEVAAPFKVCSEMEAGVGEAADQDNCKNDHADRAGRLVEFGMDSAWLGQDCTLGFGHC
jgi:hypothetical protein